MARTKGIDAMKSDAVARADEALQLVGRRGSPGVKLVATDVHGGPGVIGQGKNHPNGMYYNSGGNHPDLLTAEFLACDERCVSTVARQQLTPVFRRPDSSFVPNTQRSVRSWRTWAVTPQPTARKHTPPVKKQVRAGGGLLSGDISVEFTISSVLRSRFCAAVPEC